MWSEDSDGAISVALSSDVDHWLAREAHQRDESRDDVCRRLVTAAYAVTTDDEIEPSDLDDLTTVQSQLEAQHEEFIELVEDVRSRVIQVKREADGKAPADHDHDTYATESDLETLRDDHAALDEELTALESTVDDGFADFEEILESLLAERATLEERSTVLARAVVDLREHRDAVAEREQKRAAVDRLKLAANRLGIQTAVCDDCDSKVDLALLTEPSCPHCASAVTDVTEKVSFFGSPTLVSGEPPSLEGRVETAGSTSNDDVFEAVEAVTTTGSSATDDRDGSSPESEYDRAENASSPESVLEFDEEDASR